MEEPVELMAADEGEDQGEDDPGDHNQRVGEFLGRQVTEHGELAQHQGG